MKKLLTLIIFCLFITSLPVMAGESSSQSQLSNEELGGIKYVEFTDVSGFISINSIGKATVCADASTGNNNVTKTVLIAELMQYKNGGWLGCKEWTVTNYKDYANLTKFHYVPSGYQYKVIVTAKVYDKYGNKLDETTDSTTTVIY